MRDLDAGGIRCSFECKIINWDPVSGEHSEKEQLCTSAGRPLRHASACSPNRSNVRYAMWITGLDQNALFAARESNHNRIAQSWRICNRVGIGSLRVVTRRMQVYRS